jgi:hypothetical protein
MERRRTKRSVILERHVDELCVRGAASGRRSLLCYQDSETRR